MPTADIRNIWDYAKGLVDNKTIAARIGHSAFLHGARSAVSSKGSFASKASNLVLSAGKGLLKLIPVPGVPALLEVVAEKANEAARKYLHGSNLDAAKTAGDEVARVKFEIKELTVDEMDRYRWKVTEAMQDLNTKIREMQALSAATPCCEKYLEVVTACQQAQRRIDKLRFKVNTIRGTMDSIDAWLGTCQTNLTAGKGQITSALRTYVGEQQAACERAEVAYLPSLRSHLVDLEQRRREIEQSQRRGTLSYGFFEKNPLDVAYSDIATTDAQIKQAQAKPGTGALKFAEDIHGQCSSWCVFHTETPTDDWQDFKNNAATVTKFLVSFAVVAIPMEIAADKIKEMQTPDPASDS